MNPEIDKLLADLSHENDPVKRITILNNLSNQYSLLEPKTSHGFATEALTLAEKTSDLSLISESLLNIAFYHYQLSDYEVSLKKCKEVEEKVNDLKNDKLNAKLYRIIGLNYYRKADYDEALKYQYKCLEINRATENFSSLAATLNNIGNIYLDLKEYDAAIDHYSEAKKYYKITNNENGQLVADANIANTYNFSKEYDKAIDLYTEVIKAQKERKNYTALASIHYHLGSIYINVKKFDESESCFKKAVEYNQANGYPWITTSCLWGFGKIAQFRKNYEEAIKYYNEALIIVEKLQIKASILAIHLGLSEVYEELNNYELALYHFKKHSEVKEDVFNQHRNQHISLLKTKNLETEKEIERLKNIELKKAYDEIDEKNEEIKSSINYAKRIQYADIPTKESLKNLFRHGTCLLQAKDILSGDFYWISRFGNKSLIAIADCTGHGIPGALLTIIGNEMLNTAVETLGIHQPGAMLNYLNKALRKKFTSGRLIDDKPINDGMDIALCSFDFKYNVLEYAGANRPLYLIRNGELIETTPTKASIGGYTSPEQVFENHTISIQEGDRIFLFSDGATDQFGMSEENWRKLKIAKDNHEIIDIKRKKFMTKNFKNLLVKTAHLNIKDQGLTINDVLYKWMGDEPQTDDILIFGIEV